MGSMGMLSFGLLSSGPWQRCRQAAAESSARGWSLAMLASWDLRVQALTWLLLSIGGPLWGSL